MLDLPVIITIKWTTIRQVLLLTMMTFISIFVFCHDYNISRHKWLSAVLEPLPTGQEAKDYLARAVNPTLQKGLTALCKQKPSEPIVSIFLVILLLLKARFARVYNSESLRSIWQVANLILCGGMAICSLKWKPEKKRILSTVPFSKSQVKFVLNLGSHKSFPRID